MHNLHSFLRSGVVSSAGICSFSALQTHMSEKQIVRALALCPDAQSVLFALFPYFVGGHGNVSEYARGQDYHHVIPALLAPLLLQVRARYPANRFVILTDDSPLPEVRGAAMCGAGFRGDNGLLFDRTFGSYVFIGSVLTDLPCTPTTGAGECLHCGACQRSCPTGALQADGSVDQSRCLSALTQTNAPLTKQQERWLAEAPFIWGCDICSTVCPLSKAAPCSRNEAFLKDRVQTLAESDVADMTRRSFQETFPQRAFTWRGPAPLRRNLALQKQRGATPHAT